MFQVVRYTPIRSAIHDGYIGQRAERLPMVYCTEAWAHAKTHLLAREDSDDEVMYRVVAVNGDVWRPLCPPLRDAQLDECPF